MNAIQKLVELLSNEHNRQLGEFLNQHLDKAETHELIKFPPRETCGRGKSVFEQDVFLVPHGFLECDDPTASIRERIKSMPRRTVRVEVVSATIKANGPIETTWPVS